MGMKARAMRDIKRITSNSDEWADSMVLTSDTGETATIKGLHTKHHLGFDGELQKWVNTKNAHISFSEEVVTEANSSYPLRDASGEINLQGHKVTVADSTGLEITYRIEQWFPDETIGLIVCILGDWTDG